MRFVLLIMLVLPIILNAQSDRGKVDSLIKFGLGDTTLRRVYSFVDQVPVLNDGRTIESYLLKHPFTTEKYPCCAFKAYLAFVVEVDSSITNKNVYVKAVYCKYGLIRDGPEVKEMELKMLDLLEKFPKLKPGKFKGMNVATKLVFPIHVDCFNSE